jgi:osmotically-inducible protein OsmY
MERRQMMRGNTSLTIEQSSGQPETSRLANAVQNAHEDLSINRKVDSATNSISVVQANLVSQIRQALQSKGHLSLRGLEFLTEDGLLILRGTVPSYYLKQLAQVTVFAVPGVAEVRNEVQVELNR